MSYVYIQTEKCGVSYVYIQTEKCGVAWAENDVFTVGFYDPSGRWRPESDYGTREEAANRVAFLNGRGEVLPTLDEALNSGDRAYRP